jgi:cellulose synthase operon protein YhjU
MGFWSYYFLLKLALFWGRFIDFHVWPNLAFAVFTAIPVRQPRWRVAKQVIAIPTGIALLYHDSWLPPIGRALAQKDQLVDFNLPYLVELLGRFINVQLILALILLFLCWLLLRRRLRMATFAFLGIFVVALTPLFESMAGRLAAPAIAAGAGAPAAAVAETDLASQSPEQLDERVKTFFEAESRRRVAFPSPSLEEPPFDLMFIHICSLAWDDLDFADRRNHPLMKRFDVLMTRFNSAASYSGPAAIRLLRSGCGQPHHEGLYQPAEPECYLYNELQRAGFKPEWAMNHEGIFGNMRDDIRRLGGWDTTLMPIDDVPISLKSFDGVENGYHRDYDVLAKWWRQRLEQPAPRVALYYNTGTTHDGNRFLDGSRPNARDSFARRTDMLFGDIERFMDLVKASGRRAVIVMVPEHGAAVRGDRMQISGLRELPTPAITEVPVGIKLINGDVALPGSPQTVDTPTSFLAISELLARLMAHDPYAPGAQSLAELAQGLPQTAAVSENEGTLFLSQGSRTMMRTADGAWSPYAAR